MYVSLAAASVSSVPIRSLPGVSDRTESRGAKADESNELMRVRASIYFRFVFSGEMLLLSRDVEEELIAFDRATKGDARLYAAETQATRWRRIRERLERIEPLVLEERESVTVKLVLSNSGDDIDCTCCRAAELSRVTVIYNLRFACDC